MMLRNLVCSLTAGVAVLGIIECSWAEDRDAVETGEMVVLTDKRSSRDLPVSQQTAKNPSPEMRAELARRHASRKQHLAELRRITRDMEQGGCAIVDHADVSTFDQFVAGAMELERAPVQYGYTPTDLDRSALKKGRLIGKQPLFVDDAGLAHQMSYIYEFDTLGTVVIEELSYATIPDARITVYRPVGNLTINGYAATYTALMDESREKGLSGITYFTDSKLISVTALKCVTRDDREAFRDFVAIASAIE